MSELRGSSGLGSTYLCIFNETCIKKAALLVVAGFFHVFVCLFVCFFKASLFETLFFFLLFVFVSWQAIDDVGKSQLG